MLQFTNNIKKDNGFTIVELLVVIVVIAILATITIVSYIGITTRASASSTLANAQQLQSVIEILNADNGKYPIITTDFTTFPIITAKVPSGIIYGPAALTVASTKNFQLSTLNGAPSTGGMISYWDYTTNAASTQAKSLFWGAGTSAGVFTPFAS